MKNSIFTTCLYVLILRFVLTLCCHNRTPHAEKLIRKGNISLTVMETEKYKVEVLTFEEGHLAALSHCKRQEVQSV